MDNNDTDESNVKKEHRKDGIPLSLRVSLHSEHVLQLSIPGWTASEMRITEILN